LRRSACRSPLAARRSPLAADPLAVRRSPLAADPLAVRRDPLARRPLAARRSHDRTRSRPLDRSLAAFVAGLADAHAPFPLELP
jgi:hypothetical protein